MADIIPIRKEQPENVPEELVSRFFDWLGADSFFTMKAMVRIVSCDVYDLSENHFELEGSISLDVGFDVQAEALAMMPLGDPQAISLYFHTESVEECEQMSRRWQVGSYVIAKGEYNLLLNDSPPSFTLFINSMEDVTPLPEEYLPAARRWLKNPD